MCVFLLRARQATMDPPAHQESGLVSDVFDQCFFVQKKKESCVNLNQNKSQLFVTTKSKYEPEAADSGSSLIKSSLTLVFSGRDNTFGSWLKLNVYNEKIIISSYKLWNVISVTWCCDALSLFSEFTPLFSFSFKGPQGPQGPVGFPGPKGPNVSSCCQTVSDRNTPMFTHFT